MQVATLQYLGFTIRIEIPNPSQSAELYIYIAEANGEVRQHFPYRAKLNDPNQWITEAVSVAVRELPSSLTILEPPMNTGEPQDLDDIPF